MIFVTFFGSCLGIALLVAALGTKFWIVARARRDSNPEESDGRIHFGLFDGKKELNVAYGWRTYDVNGELLSFVNFCLETGHQLQTLVIVEAVYNPFKGSLQSWRG